MMCRPRTRPLVSQGLIDRTFAAARQRINAGKGAGQEIDNLPKALSEVLTAFASDLLRLQPGSPPIGLDKSKVTWPVALHTRSSSGRGGRARRW